MGTRGIVFVVRAPRRDGGWIDFRTCDHVEASRLATRFGTDVTVLGPGPRTAR